MRAIDELLPSSDPRCAAAIACEIEPGRTIAPIAARPSAVLSRLGVPASIIAGC